MSAYYDLSREEVAEERAIARRAALAEGVDWRIHGDDDRFRAKDWLSDAAYSGDLEVVTQAFTSGYDWGINDRTSGEQSTILMAAVRGAQVEVVEWLLAHGADPDAGVEGDWKGCPLHICGSRDSDRGKPPGSFLRIAAMLIAAGANVNARRGVLGGQPNAGGDTVLHCATQDGGVSFMKLLLKMGADIHARAGADYLSPLQIAFCSEVEYSHILPDRMKYRACRVFLEDVLRAGSWKAYVLAPRKELLALRVLCERGRARTAGVSAPSYLGVRRWSGGRTPSTRLVS